MLTLAQQLDNIHARHRCDFDVRKLPPWLRVAQRKREVRVALELLEGVGRDPSDQRDRAYDDYAEALAMFHAELGKIKANVALAAAMRRQEQRAA